MTAKTYLLGGAAALAIILAGCDSVSTPTDADTATTETGDSAASAVDEAALADNPLLQDWDTAYGVPPFAQIKDEHYLPAMNAAIVELEAEIDAIANNPDAPTFENTIVALDKAGSSLSQVASTFSNITNTDTNDTLADLETQIWPKVTAVQNSINFNETLFERVSAVNDAAENLDLDEQGLRLIELTYRGFDRAGATQSPEVKEKVAAINEEVSSLTTSFAQNLLASTKAFKLEITDEADLVGLSEDFKAAIKDGDKWILTVDRSVYETFMTQSENRDLRAQMFDGYRLRANSGDNDNGPIAIKLAQLRAERAELLGYQSHAHYTLEYNMARTPQTVEDFLVRVWEPGLAQAKAERDTMQAMIGDEFTFAGHDWWHYSEKVRQDKYAFDDNVLKPYFELSAVRAGAWTMAERLFNVTLEDVDIDGWNPVVTSYDVKDKDTGEHLGLFMMDMYARDSKRGGAWMSSYRSSTNYDDAEEVRPIITNNLNLITPAGDGPTLMRFDEVETFFHEFGHGLHGMLSDVTYGSLSGTNVTRDFVELPSQLFEHWMRHPKALERFARHHKTGEPMPADLLKRLQAARNFNQGFSTVEYTASALVDMALHAHPADNAIEDVEAFETATLEKIGMPKEIIMRHRLPHFMHITGGYAAGYYSYLWSEVMDADAFGAFEEAGDIYDAETAKRLKTNIYAAGNKRDPEEAYRGFRGRGPEIESLMKKRGFAV